MSIKGIIWFLNILSHSRDIYVFDICKLDSILTTQLQSISVFHITNIRMYPLQ